MGDDPLVMFSGALSADKSMQAGLQTAIGEKKDAEALAAIAAFAAEQGFELTRENLTQLQHRAGPALAEGALSDADLDGVAGGVGDGVLRHLHNVVVEAGRRAAANR